MRPVAFLSHRLSHAKCAYPVHERELLAIVLALRVCHHLLYGSDFEVVRQTDHRPLQHFLIQANLSGRQDRWQQFLSQYNLQVAYVTGAVNTLADGLSRCPDLRLMFIGAVAPYDSRLSRIIAAYSQDPVVSKILRTATSFNMATSATWRRDICWTSLPSTWCCHKMVLWSGPRNLPSRSPTRSISSGNLSSGFLVMRLDRAPLFVPTLWTSTPLIGSLMMSLISPFVVGSVNGAGMISHNLVLVPSVCGGGIGEPLSVSSKFSPKTALPSVASTLCAWRS
jgi:hypothetical protein